MSTVSKAERYRRLALRETNKAVIGLFHRLADEAERRELAKAAKKRAAGPGVVVSMSLWLAQRYGSMSFAGSH
jgi:hypothetical protein